MTRGAEALRAMATDLRVDVYIEASADFARPLLIWLRERVHAAAPEVDESIKWSRPAFLLGGRPFAMMAAFKAHASFDFWAPGADESTPLGRFDRITGFADLPDERSFEELVRAAAIRRADGARPKRPPSPPKPESALPTELAAALAEDAAAKAVFAGLPPSARRDYCEWVGEAKRAETRALRVAEAVAWLREGKRRNWRYE